MSTRRLRLALPLLAALWLGQATAQAPVARTYTLGSIDAIEIAGAATVRYVQGPAGSTDQVLVTGDDETQKSVSLDVRDGVLTIRPAGAWKFWNARRVQVEVVSRSLRRVGISGAADLVAAGPVQAGRLVLGISGAGNARFDQLRAEHLRFQVSGAGDGQAAGSVTELQVHVSGRGDFRGEHLMTQRAQVSISGIGSARVWAEQELGVSVSGIGTVDVWGTPTVHRHTSGIGKVNEHGAKAALPLPASPAAPAAPAALAAPAAPAAPPSPATPPAAP